MSAKWLRYSVKEMRQRNSLESHAHSAQFISGLIDTHMVNRPHPNG